MAFLAVGGLTRRNAEKHIGLLLYGAVRSELQLSVSLSSVRHHLLEPLVRGNAHNVSVHASIDCSLPCTVASVRSAMTYYRLEPELLHVEEGTNSTDNMERYTRAMQHAVRASASALREDAKMAICARIDLEYASVLRPELVPPGATAPWQVVLPPSSPAVSSLQSAQGWPLWIIVPDGSHMTQLNDRFCYGPMGTIMAFLQLRLRLLDDGRGHHMVAEHGSCIAARMLNLTVNAARIRTVRRRWDLRIPDADLIFGWRSMPERSWMRLAPSSKFCNVERKIQFWSDPTASCPGSSLICRNVTAPSSSITNSSGKMARRQAHVLYSLSKRLVRSQSEFTNSSSITNSSEVF